MSNVSLREITAENRDADEFDEVSAMVLFGAVNDDIRRLIDLVNSLDMLRCKIGVRRAAERLG